MRRRNAWTIFWAACYLGLALGPLALLLFVGSDLPSRGFWIELSAGLGFLALAMFALQFVLTARFKGIAAPHGLDTIIQFHREAGLAAVGFALLHPVIMIAKEPSYIEFLDPRVMPGRAWLLAGTIAAMLLIIGLTFGRQRLAIRYEWWRLSHGVLGVFIVVAALIHIMQVEWYVAESWQKIVWIVLTCAALLLLAHVRIVKPLQMRKQPYRVVDVKPEGKRTWVISLEPMGHPAMKFKPGQFAWLTLGPSPFSLQQHPFSVASSAMQTDRIEFAIRELGDFTSTIATVKPGTPAFLEGPYGAFTPELDDSRSLVLIAGGVGMAPMMSILRTLRDRGDPRAIHLIYAARVREDIMFAEELNAMKQSLNLQVTFVLDSLEAHLPKSGDADPQYFICGPGPMMDIVETYLDRIGVSGSRIHSERFDIA